MASTPVPLGASVSIAHPATTKDRPTVARFSGASTDAVGFDSGPVTVTVSERVVSNAPVTVLRACVAISYAPGGRLDTVSQKPEFANRLPYSLPTSLRETPY